MDDNMMELLERYAEAKAAEALAKYHMLRDVILQSLGLNDNGEAYLWGRAQVMAACKAVAPEEYEDRIYELLGQRDDLPRGG